MSCCWRWAWRVHHDEHRPVADGGRVHHDEHRPVADGGRGVFIMTNIVLLLTVGVACSSW